METNLPGFFNHASWLANLDTKELEEWVDRHPFFAAAQLLLAKKYQQENNPKWERQLARAALLVHDRKLLYALMKNAGETHELSVSQAPAQLSYEEKEKVPGDVFRDDESLYDVLKSIHQRKQAILDSAKDERPTAPPELIKVNPESPNPELEEVAASVAEFSPIMLEEENTDDFIKLPSEGDALNLIEEEAFSQLEYEGQEDMLLVNELAGGGAEYIPTEFTNMEGSEEEFILEQDVEIQSLGVIEEEFIAREPDVEKQEAEMEMVSVAEKASILDATASEEIGEDASSKVIQSEVAVEAELAEYNPDASGIRPGDDSFRITEEVNSPGEFLPEKSYRFSEWLKFFRLSQPPPTVKKEVQEKDRQQGNSALEEAGRVNKHMQQELESIDKVVSTIHPESKPADASVSAEVMAKKSSQMDDEIVSETLAKIFEAQGHYDKAIRMYVKLSLKVPDKVSFFAARIKELKSKK
jgi:hypothetical protein